MRVVRKSFRVIAAGVLLQRAQHVSPRGSLYVSLPPRLAVRPWVACPATGDSADGEDQHPYFFRGDLIQPKQTAELLRSLMRRGAGEISPAARNARADSRAGPIPSSLAATIGLGSKGFRAAAASTRGSICFPARSAAKESDVGRPTSTSIRRCWRRCATIRESERVSLAIGAAAVELATSRETLLEKKVKLPLRWLKGLVEVQACQSRMRPVLDASGLEASRFLKSLPRMKTNRRETWIVPVGAAATEPD